MKRIKTLQTSEISCQCIAISWTRDRGYPIKSGRKHKLKLFLFLLIFSLSHQLDGQSLFKKYTVLDGMVSNSVSNMGQDSTGFIWVGSAEGLSRYDGYKFTQYTTSNGLSHNMVNMVFSGEDGLWVVENNGAIESIENDGVRLKYKIPDRTNKMIRFNDRLLVSTDTTGLYELIDETKVKLVKPLSGQIIRLTNLGDSLLIGTSHEGESLLFDRDLNILCAYEEGGGESEFFFYPDSKQRLWVGTSNGLHLVRISHTDGYCFRQLPLPPVFSIEQLQKGPIRDMVEMPDGVYWFATKNGLVKIDPDGTHRIFTQSDGLQSSNIDRLFRDRENNLWIATQDGLAKWSSQISQFENLHIDPAPQYMQLLGRKNIILSFDNDIQLFSPSTDSLEKIKVPDFRQHMAALGSLTNDEHVPGVDYTLSKYLPVRQSSPQLYITPPFLLQYDEKENAMTFYQEKPYNVPDHIHAAVQHPSGLVFWGTDGLYVIDPDIPGKQHKILDHRISKVIVDKEGTMWVGTWEDGLFQIGITPGSDFENMFQVTNRTSLFNKNEIRALFCDSHNRIWVGSRYDGLACLSPDKDSGKYVVKHYTRETGLLSNWIKCFAESPEGNIWIGHRSGLELLVRSDSGYRLFNYSKAMNINRIVGEMYSFDRRTWYIDGFFGGAFKFKSKPIYQNKPLSACILSATFGSDETQVNAGFDSDFLRLNYKQNVASFEFSAPGFINEDQILYSYRLVTDRANNGWSTPRNVHEALYHRLSPGQYQFEVKTIGWNGESGVPATYSFSIRPPVHQRWWFIALCIIAFAGVLYTAYAFRVRELLRREQIRNRIASDLHDDLGSSLSSIHLLSEMASNEAKAALQKDLLSRVSRHSRETMDKISDIVWTIKPVQDEGLALQERIQQFLFEICGAADIKHHFSEEGLAGLKLTLEQKKTLYLVFKEAVNNAVKYAQASCIKVAITQRNKQIELMIEDNGMGFNPADSSGGNGLTNMKKRAEALGGRTKITSSIGVGTTVLCSLPL